MGFREADLDRKRSRGAQGRDIGAIPAVRNPSRRRKSRLDLMRFLQTYLPSSFPLPFGECHKQAIKKTEQSLLNGGLFALAMPRGSGKTTMAEGALIWSALYGHRQYAVLIHANAEKAKTAIESIRREIESNEEIAADFPEIAYPVEKLEGIPLRANGQLCRGQPTNIKWGSKIVFPTIEESREANNAGCIIEAVGIGGSLRGRRYNDRDGVKRRPDFVLLDDPQDREDAESQGETDKRERIIRSDVLGMAGHGKKIAGMLLCTVIQKNDLADRMLSLKLHPEWRGEKTGMIMRYPKEKDGLWREYFELRRNGMAEGDNGKEANAFYRKNRKVMDSDAEVSWPARHGKGETPIQFAMNLLCDIGEEAFASEYQNEPIETVNIIHRLDDESVARNVNNYCRYEVPTDAPFLVGGIDVNLYGLTFAIVAFRPDWTARVVDYGMVTDGGKQRKEMSDAQYVATMLADTLSAIDSRQYATRLNGVLVDRGYMPDAVASVLRSTRKRFKLAASIGRAAHQHKPSRDIIRGGNGWHEKNMSGVLTILHNADQFRTQAQTAFGLAHGVPGSATMWNDSPRSHRVFAQQICNEFLVGVDDDGKHTWKQKPGTRHDCLDAVVMAYVGAAALGVGSAKQTVVNAAKKARKRGPIKAQYSEV